MLNFFKKNKANKSNKYNLNTKATALMIHAAKIDENYSDIEKKIIKKTLFDLGTSKEELEEVFKNAEILEKNSNQILEFTKEIKNTDEKFKIKIIESLWKIIYSDKKSDIYESNFMRRLTGLLYLDNKVVGNIKEKIKKTFTNDLLS